MTVRAYLRVSTDQQADSGAGLAAQRDAIEREAAHRGWDDVEWYVDGGFSGKDLERPQMARLLSEIMRGDLLVTAKVDRLSRSLVDFATLVERSQKAGWSIVTLDLGLDLSTAQGEFVASILAAFARMERRLIGQRTKDAMAAKKALGGVRFGHRSRIPMAIQEQVEALWLSGLSMCEVARRMTAQGVPTAEGYDRWHASTVSTVLSSLRNAGLATRRRSS
jgi:DNA invertase Pin-like site-specific DNA recombinase